MIVGSLAHSPFWQVFLLSDWLSKYIILFGLFILSIVCVTVIIYKCIQFNRQKYYMRLLLDRARQAKTLGELSILSNAFPKSVGGMLIARSLKKLTLHSSSSGRNQVLSSHDLEYFELVMNQIIDSLVMDQEQFVPFLGVSAAVSPLIGLFGTIWGLIYSFISISQEKSADITVIAPGIASALLTTLAGLIVAIPAMIFFHYLSNELRKREVHLVDLSDIIINMVKYSSIKQGSSS